MVIAPWQWDVRIVSYRGDQHGGPRVLQQHTSEQGADRGPSCRRCECSQAVGDGNQSKHDLPWQKASLKPWMLLASLSRYLGGGCHVSNRGGGGRPATQPHIRALYPVISSRVPPIYVQFQPI